MKNRATALPVFVFCGSHGTCRLVPSSSTRVATAAVVDGEELLAGLAIALPARDASSALRDSPRGLGLRARHTPTRHPTSGLYRHDGPYVRRCRTLQPESAIARRRTPPGRRFVHEDRPETDGAESSAQRSALARVAWKGNDRALTMPSAATCRPRDAPRRHRGLRCGDQFSLAARRSRVLVAQAFRRARLGRDLPRRARRRGIVGACSCIRPGRRTSRIARTS